MTPRQKAWVAMGLLLAGALVVNAWQRARVEQLRAETRQWRIEEERMTRLREENARLRRSAATAEELATIAKQQTDAQRWRERVAELNRSLQAPTSPGVAARQKWEMPESGWRYVGRAEPRFALESALWAAVAGEVDMLAEQLVFDEPARRRAEEFLAGLPSGARQMYPTPERLIALMTAKEAPTGLARLVDEKKRGDHEVALRVRLEDANGQSRMANLVVRQQTDGWRFVVPERAVARYVDQLKGVR